MVKEIKNVVTWLKNWFYDKNEVYTKSQTYQKTEVDNALNSKLNSNLTTANKMLVTDGSGDVTLEDKPVIQDITSKADKTGGVQQITDVNSHTSLGTTANATQGTINTAIDTAIGNLQSIKAIEVVATLPTASASTMGRLYIVSENSKVNVYYTEETEGTYAWHKMDTDILDELSISWDDVTDKPSTFTPSSHTHGHITNDGKIATTVSVASGDSILISDYSESSRIKKVDNILTGHVKDPNAHNHIDSVANATQSSINIKINTAIANLKSSRVTSMELIPKGSDPSADAYDGVIRLYYGDEPQNE